MYWHDNSKYHDTGKRKRVQSRRITMQPANLRNTIMLGIVLAGAVAITGLPNAEAGPWRGGYPGLNTAPCSQCGSAGYPGGRSIEERNAFLDETAELRKQFASKRAEMHALMRNDNPDAKRAAQLQGEIFDLREQLRLKAREKGIEDLGLGRGTVRGCQGPGPGGFRGRI